MERLEINFRATKNRKDLFRPGDGVGIFVTNNDKQANHIAIVSQKGLLPWIGLNFTKLKNGQSTDGCPLALAFDENQKPYIQINDPETKICKMLGYDEIMNIASMSELLKVK